jgi:hypothetical protein
VDAREGGETLGLVHSRPGLELAAAASNGAGGGLTAARPGQEGSAPLYGRPGSPLATTGPSAASMGARAGLGRSEWQGEGTDRRSVGHSRPDSARREERVDSEAALGRAWLRGTSLGKARGGSDVEAAYGTHARALWHAGARATSRRPEIVSDWPCLSEIFSKNLNTSARSDEYEICRSSYPLQLL